MKALETKRMLSMAYHPQTDSQIKRINQEIGMSCNITSITNKMTKHNG